MKIKIADLYIGERRRKDYGETEMEDLVKDMKENGQITAITVRPPNDEDRAADDYEGQPWVLVAGGRRTTAAALLGWEEIEGYAREEMESITHRILELHENLKRKAMTWQEEVAAKAEIAALRKEENPELEDWEIAKELGQSAATFSRDLKTARILEKNPGLKKAGSKHAALNAGKILEENEQRSKLRLGQPTGGSKPPEGVSVPPIEERIVTAEAFEFVKKLPSNSVDLFLLDGPYGYNYWKQGQKTAKGEEHLSSYDDSPEATGIMYRQLFPQLVRAARETGWLVMFCGKETYDFLEDLALECCAVHGAYRHNQYPNQCESSASGPGQCRFLKPEPFPWFWYRPNSRNQPRFPQLHAKNMAELILVVNLGKGRLVKQPRPNVLVHEAEYTDRVHANQKPVPLYRDLIESFTFAGDTVVDCFFGSGNSLAAAASLARVPWGCDKNPEMLQFARGAVERYQQPITRTIIQQSFERYQQGLLRNIPEDTSAVEGEQLETPQRPASKRKEGLSFEFEIFRVGQEYLGYIKYDGHTMGQLRSDSEDYLNDKLMEATEILDNLSILGAIDPCVCSPDEAMEAYRSYMAAIEDSLEEEIVEL